MISVSKMHITKIIIFMKPKLCFSKKNRIWKQKQNMDARDVDQVSSGYNLKQGCAIAQKTKHLEGEEREV